MALSIGQRCYDSTVLKFTEFCYDLSSLCYNVKAVNKCLGGLVVRALARDRKVASSTPGQSATDKLFTPMCLCHQAV